MYYRNITGRTLMFPSAQVIDGSLKSRRRRSRLKKNSRLGNKIQSAYGSNTILLSNNDRIFATYTDGGNYSDYTSDEPDYQMHAERLSNNFDILCNSTAICRSQCLVSVLAVNTTISSPASDRVKMYVNGVQESLINHIQMVLILQTQHSQVKVMKHN